MVEDQIIIENCSAEEVAEIILKKLEEWHILSTDMPSFPCLEESGTNTASSVKNAKVLISGGRGIGTAEYFDTLRELAKLLGGEVSSSRANVDAGWISSNRQVGQTSNIVSPELYLALGISGTPQHLAGIRGAKRIIAINKRKDASIFGVADLGVIADLHEIVPIMISRLKEWEGK